MSTTNEVPGPPRRRRRRWPWAIAAIVAIPILLFASIPWIASSPWAKPKLEAVADRALAPGGVSFDRICVSWFRPTEIVAPALLDAKGRKLVAAPTGTFSWSLWQILFAKPIVGTLTMHGGAVEIGRSAEGNVDLIETLKPLLKERPEHTIEIRIQDATLQFTQQGVADPFYADHADVNLDLTRYPEPIAWDFKLRRDKAPGGPGKMNIAGNLGRVQEGVNPTRNAAIAVSGERWPWRIEPTVGELKGLKTSGLFSGSLEAKMLEGNLTTSGDATVDDFLAAGPKLSGDEVSQPRIKFGWKAQGKGGVYQVDRFAFDAPAATLHARGEFPPSADRSATLEGRVDLTFANQLRHTLRLLEDLTIEKGAVEIRAKARARPVEPGAAPAQSIDVTANLVELEAKKGERTIAWNDPTTLAVALDRTPDAIRLDRLDVRTPFLTATGKGDLDSGILVDASFDLAAARAKAREWVDLGAFEAAGAGTLHARYSRKEGNYQFAADGGVKGLELAGLPVLETVRRDEIRAEAAVRGEAAPSGVPRDWRFGSLLVKSAEDELKLETTAVAGRPTPATVEASGRTTVDLGGAKRVVEASGSVTADAGQVNASDLRVATSHFVGPGGAFVPEEPYTWRGSARYEFDRDVLNLARREGTEDGEKPPAFSIDRVTAGGLRSRGSTWFRVTLSGDLASIEDVLGIETPSLVGALSAQVDARQNRDVWGLDAVVQGKDIIETTGKPQAIGDAALTLASSLDLKARRLDVARLALETPYGKADGQGTVAMPEDAPVVDMNGMLAPDWDRLTRELAARVEPNASIRGRPQAWSLSGRIPLDDKAGSSKLAGAAGIHLDLVDVFGMRLEETALAVRMIDGRVAIDPIDGTLNGGRLRLDPAITTDDQGGRWLRLGKGSSLAGAVVNDEVSHRVLSYVAPVLDQSTRVQGAVSFDLVDAQFSLDGDATKTRVEGDVQFDDVRFMPGPLVDQLIAVFNLERKAIFVLRDPVSIQILGRKIFQEGLILPVGEVAVIGIEGWMDFDKRIDMLATFAAVPPRRNIPVLSVLLENAQIRVPLTGTLDNPKIDGERIKERFKDFGESLLETTLGVGAGIGDLFRRGPGRPRPAPPARVVPPAEGPELVVPRLDAAPTPTPRPSAPQPSAPPPPTPGLEPDAGEPEILLPGLRLPFSRTPEERQLQKEAREQRRLEKRNERRARQGLPPS